jgi:hypothetical protein
VAGHEPLLRDGVGETSANPYEHVLLYQVVYQVVFQLVFQHAQGDMVRLGKNVMDELKYRVIYGREIRECRAVLASENEDAVREVTEIRTRERGVALGAASGRSCDVHGDRAPIYWRSV